jgi:catechol 2,3-dioxygenase-like lactoylglutathione lyase family enzyme
MLDHISLKVGAYARAQDFYDRALKPLGVARVMGDGQFFGGYGSADKPYFWIGQGGQGGGGVHVAFAASDRAAVDAFYAAAIAAGGRDNGPPGIRAHYHPNYYGAFVLDPDGNNIEAVCHAPG